MAASQLKLPGDFEAGKTYWLKGETINAWRRALLADRAIAGPNLSEFQTPMGRILHANLPGGINANIKVEAVIEGSDGFERKPANDFYLVVRNGSIIEKTATEPTDTPPDLLAFSITHLSL